MPSDSERIIIIQCKNTLNLIWFVLSHSFGRTFSIDIGNINIKMMESSRRFHHFAYIFIPA